MKVFKNTEIKHHYTLIYCLGRSLHSFLRVLLLTNYIHCSIGGKKFEKLPP